MIRIQFQICILWQFILWNYILDLGEEPHLNTSLKHFVYFCNEFRLIEEKQYAPLRDLIDKLINKEPK